MKDENAFLEQIAQYYEQQEYEVVCQRCGMWERRNGPIRHQRLLWYLANAYMQVGWQEIVDSREADQFLDEAATRLEQLKSHTNVDEEIVAALPNAFAELYNYRGCAAYNRNDDAAAVNYFGQSAKLNPKVAHVYRHWGMSLTRQKNFDEAVAKFKKVAQLEPNLPLLYNSWGAALMNQKKWKQAQKQFAKAISLYAKEDIDNPNRYFPLINQATCHYNLSEFAEAIEAFEKSILVQPERFDGAELLGRSYAKTNLKLEDVATANALIKLTPERRAEVFNGWGSVWYEDKEYETARAAYERALNTDPQAAYAEYNRGLCFRQSSQYAEAVAAYENALGLAKSQSLQLDLWNDLVFCHQQLGYQLADARRAQQYWQKALRYAELARQASTVPSDWLIDRLLESQYMVGYVEYDLNQQFEKALYHFRQVTSTAPAERWYYYWSFHYEGRIHLEALSSRSTPEQVWKACLKTEAVIARLDSLTGEALSEFELHLQRGSLYTALSSQAWKELTVRYRFDFQESWQRWIKAAHDAYEIAALSLKKAWKGEDLMDHSTGYTWILKGAEFSDELFNAYSGTRRNALTTLLSNWGGLMHDFGDFEQAKALYNRVVESTPESYIGPVNLAFLLYNSGRLDEAVQQLDKVLQASYRQEPEFFNYKIDIDK